MADSITTKKALANALKELMKETSFHKITISDICNRCNMSRKSFYYHFKDKYDLVNWIFDYEYLSRYPAHYVYDSGLNDRRWDLIEDLCEYFYTNRAFYSKVFRIKGQNCFTDYFRQLIIPLLEARTQQISNDTRIVRLCTAFYADGILSAIERWIIEFNTITSREFVDLLKTCVENLPEHK